MSDLDEEELKATRLLKNTDEKELDELKKRSIEETCKFLKSPDVEIVQEKSADEMFEKLGYIDYYETDIFFKYVGENKKEIIFNKIYKLIEYKHYEFDFIDMQELQAINKKCKELGWIDEV